MTSTETECGRSSGVEHNLAKVRVESSNLFARSNSGKLSETTDKAAFGWPFCYLSGLTDAMRQVCARLAGHRG